MSLISRATRRSTTQAYAYLVLIFFWAFFTASIMPEELSLQQASVAFLLLGIAWANSSFDPIQNSKVHLIWQYAAPWVVGGMSFLSAPTGMFLGFLMGSAMIGLMTGIALGAVLSGVLLFWICIATSSYYAFRESQSMSDHTTQQTLRGFLKQRLSKRLNFHLSSAVLSLFWSFFQGLTIVGLIAVGMKFSGPEGIVGMLLWTCVMVLSVMRFHLAARGQWKRGPRFLLLWLAISSGGIAGLLMH